MQNYRYQSPEYTRRTNRSSMPQRAYNADHHDTAPTSCCHERNECDDLRGMPLAMAYVPWQTWRNLMDADKGFCCGTIFEELNKPFRGIGGNCK